MPHSPVLRVRAHRNLHAPAGTVMWSVTPKSGLNKGLVVTHASKLLLSNCNFVISRPGQKKVQASRVRSVFAWIEGDLSAINIIKLRYPDKGFSLLPPIGNVMPATQVVFHSFNQMDFETTQGAVVTRANCVLLNDDGRCMVDI